MALWYFKCASTIFSLCPILGMTGSTIEVWTDYSLEVGGVVMKREKFNQFDVKWPSSYEMRDSSTFLENKRIMGSI